MKILLKLLLAHVRRHRTRTWITLAAIAVAVTGVGVNLQGLHRDYGQRLEYSQNLGRYEAVISPATMGSNELPQDLVAAMTDDPSVAAADPLYRIFSVEVLEPVVPTRGPFGGGSLVVTDSAMPPQPLAEGRWFDGGEPGAVISSNFKERTGLGLGGRVHLRMAGGALATEVVGIVKVDSAPGFRAPPPPHIADIMLPRSLAGKLGIEATERNMVAFDLKDDADIEAFVQRWEDRTAEAYPPASLRSKIDKVTDFDGQESSETDQMLQATSTFLWTMLAGFIVFLSLNIGARNRQRQFAILRALAMSRSQALFSIGAEALAFALIGWLLGMVLLILAAAAGVFGLAGGIGALGGTVITVSLCCVLTGSLLAAIPVSWRVARIKPVDILGGRGVRAGGRVPRALTVAGLLLIAVNPVLILLGRFEPVREFLEVLAGGRIGFGAPLVGSILMIVGFALITPQAILAAERLFTPVGSRLLRLDGRFLRQQLSAGLWRTVGTTIALSAGLALYVTSLVWGYSMLVPFTPSESMPRIQLSIPQGLSERSIDAVRALPEVRDDTFVTVALEQLRLSKATLERPGFAHVHPDQQCVLFMGVDPDLALGGGDPNFDFSYLEGDRQTVIDRMKSGRHCIIPASFATQCKLKVGDRFSVEVPDGEGDDVAYTVAAVAEMPGWNWLTKFSGVRTRAVRALALVFVPQKQACSDFHIEKLTHFWFAVEEKAPAAAATAASSERRGPDTRPVSDARPGSDARPKPGSRSPEKRRERGRRGPPGRGGGNPLSSPAAAALTAKVERIALGEMSLPPTATPPKITVTDTDAVMALLSGRADDVIWSMTIMPLLMLAISSLAVCNTILASIRARYWQFGILRSIGLTRGQLIRLILGESLQLWLAATALSLVTGIALGWAGTRLCTLFFFFAGHTPPLVVPWNAVGLGILVGLVVCVAGAIIPALTAGRRKPLHFIQRGRLAT